MAENPPQSLTSEGSKDEQVQTIVVEEEKGNNPLDARQPKEQAEMDGTRIDQHDMYVLGRKQELNRNFRFISILGFACTLMSSWETILTTSIYALIDGGAAGLLWGYIITFFGYLLVFASVAEMASMAPTSGGQYHWVSEFAPKSSQKFLSYLTGWICVTAWQTAVTAMAFLAGTIIQGVIILDVSTYEVQRYHGTFLTIGVMVFAILFNTFLAQRLPMVEGFVLILHIFGFFAVVITLWCLAPRHTANYVFLELQNNGGWDTMGTSFLVGMLTPLYSLLGADGAVHMCEEIKDASRVTPKAIMSAICLNGCLGFIVVVTYCFALGDITELLTPATGYPFIQVFYNVTQSYTGATLLTSVLIVTITSACISNLATASRQLWSFSRDRGMPFSSTLAYVRPGWNIPLNAVLVSLAITVILSMINIGSTVALNAITAACVSCLLASYILPISCLLIKRFKNEPLPPRRWTLGRFGLPINLAAVCFLSVMFVFTFFPLAIPVTPSTMNWNIVLFVGLIGTGLAYYVAHGKNVYVGPVELVKKELRAQGLY